MLHQRAVGPGERVPALPVRCEDRDDELRLGARRAGRRRLTGDPAGPLIGVLGRGDDPFRQPIDDHLIAAGERVQPAHRGQPALLVVRDAGAQRPGLHQPGGLPAARVRVPEHRMDVRPAAADHASVAILDVLRRRLVQELTGVQRHDHPRAGRIAVLLVLAGHGDGLVVQRAGPQSFGEAGASLDREVEREMKPVHPLVGDRRADVAEKEVDVKMPGRGGHHARPSAHGE